MENTTIPQKMKHARKTIHCKVQNKEYNTNHHLTTITNDCWLIILDFIILNKCSCFKKDIIFVSRNVCRSWRIRNTNLLIQKRFNVTNNNLKDYINNANRMSMREYNKPTFDGPIDESFDEPLFYPITIPIKRELSLRTFTMPYDDYDTEYVMYSMIRCKTYFVPSIAKKPKMEPLTKNNRKFVNMMKKCHICEEQWQIDPFVFNCNNVDHKCKKRGCCNHIFIGENEQEHQYCIEHAHCIDWNKTKNNCDCCLQNVDHKCREFGYHFMLEKNCPEQKKKVIKLTKTFQPIKQNPMHHTHLKNLIAQANGKTQRKQHNIMQPRK